MLVFLLLPSTSLASIISGGTCDPNVRGYQQLFSFTKESICPGTLPLLKSPVRLLSGISNFNKASYLGQWYEYSNVFEIYQDLPFGGNCVRATYTEEGDEVGVFNEFVSPVTGYGNIKGSATFADPDDPLGRGELIVGFGPFGRKKRFALGDSSRPNYSVVGTDYSSYAVVYTCNPFGLLKKESLWILTRDQLPSKATVQAAFSVILHNKLPYRSLKVTTQTGCSLLPGSNTK